MNPCDKNRIPRAGPRVPLRFLPVQTWFYIDRRPVATSVTFSILFYYLYSMQVHRTPVVDPSTPHGENAKGWAGLGWAAKWLRRDGLLFFATSLTCTSLLRTRRTVPRSKRLERATCGYFLCFGFVCFFHSPLLSSFLLW